MPTPPPHRDALPLRRTLGESPLVRRLGAWASGSADAARLDPAERLSQWLSVADAITLHSVHQSMRATGTARPEALRPAAVETIDRELARVRAALVSAIEGNDSAGTGIRRGRPRPPARATATTPPTDFAVYHQRYLSVQRQMALRIEAMRDQVRQMLAQASPRLGQLAALDAAMDLMLAVRAHKLLSTVPAFVEARFKQLHKTDPESPASWRPGFEQEFQDVLLAELEVRMQPVLGMVEALRHETKKNP